MVVSPTSIPVEVLHSFLGICPRTTEIFFGKDYQLKGTESVHLVLKSGESMPIPVHPTEKTAARLSRADILRVDRLHLRVAGPRGSVTVKTAERIPRRLLMPVRTAQSWGVPIGSTVDVAARSVVFKGVTVAVGRAVVFEIDATDAAAAELATEDTASIVPGYRSVAHNARPERDVSARRLITETDVRQAKLHGRKIRVQPGQVVTPAALDLGRELHVFEE